MAINVSLSTSALLPFKPDIVNSPSQKCFSLQFPRQTYSKSSHKTPSSLKVSSKSTDSLSSTITKLEEGKSPVPNNSENQYPKITIRNIADKWQEIHGKNNWSGLLDPMDPILRSELIRYGEMTQATYDGFFFDQYSQYCGTCRYMHLEFFQKLGLDHLGYYVSRYLFATSTLKFPKFFRKSVFPTKWSSNANWIGYVAVSNDETTARLGRRDIVICWRGTVTGLEWLEDLMSFQKPISDYKIQSPEPNVKAESGFLDLYTDKDPSCRYCKFSAREQILAEIKKLTEKYPGEELSITITGHSLGGALAVLSAFDIAETALQKMEDSKRVKVCAFTFAGPRVGNVRFRERMEKLGVKVLRVFNVHDVVPKSPGLLLNEKLPDAALKVVEGLPWCYTHVGVELALDHTNSPYLKEHASLPNAHNLEAQLHLLDGYHGKGTKFELAIERDIALVNKSSDFLKDELLVPPSWKQDENKGMVFQNGRWVEPERPKPDDHSSDVHHHLQKVGLLLNSSE
ncbi:hypothetical protein JCGZ_21835 [Jatropha curcas]|uniref:Fungal lipase-type domain-containing protein n=1 Tax=Jatropha curcas TaxID=180498 RepID=A0A067JPA4_JATCU|nr:phospholipase A1-Igamma2, chloroplastic [Jatropha curcas]KDP21364.1 hypothetical protein JCGZ_21835 [Jatropha curcas]